MAKKTAQQRNNDTPHISPEQMVAKLQDQINLLMTLQEAIMYAFYGTARQTADPQPEAAAPPRQARKVHSRGRKRGQTGSSNLMSNRVIITDVLNSAGEPLTLQRVMMEMQARGWKTTSKNPISVVSVTLGSMRRAGDVMSADGKWSLTTTFQAAYRAAREHQPEVVAA